jgi:hypothetical protein
MSVGRSDKDHEAQRQALHPYTRPRKARSVTTSSTPGPASRDDEREGCPPPHADGTYVLERIVRHDVATDKYVCKWQGWPARHNSEEDLGGIWYTIASDQDWSGTVFTQDGPLARSRRQVNTHPLEGAGSPCKGPASASAANALDSTMPLDNDAALSRTRDSTSSSSGDELIIIWARCMGQAECGSTPRKQRSRRRQSLLASSRRRLGRAILTDGDEGQGRTARTRTYLPQAGG